MSDALPLDTPPRGEAPPPQRGGSAFGGRGVSRVRRLLLVRHGLPDYRDGKASDEPPGPPLAPIGRSQIEQAAAIVAAFTPRCVYSSPLARARQSAEIVRRAANAPLRIDPDLKEWHRTDGLYRVTERNARWLHRWLRRDERCAVVVGHASPLLAILRTALYLPQRSWYAPGVSERFEMSMGSVFELTVTPDQVVARRLFHPSPRIMEFRGGKPMRFYPRPVNPGERAAIRRPNLGRIIGYPPSN